MFQVIENRRVFVVDIPEVPLGPVQALDTPELRPYVVALNAANAQGLVATPGKYGIFVDAFHTTWLIYKINE